MASVNHPTTHGRDIGTDTSGRTRAAQMGRGALTGEVARYLGAISPIRSLRWTAWAGCMRAVFSLPMSRP